MTRLVTTAAALCLIAGPAIAQQSAAPAATSEQPAEEEAGRGIVVPAGSPLRLASISNDQPVNATFNGRVEISGTYQIERYGEEVYASLWPDSKSRELLPHWRGWGDTDEIYISNPLEFAKAVVSADELAKLKVGRLPLIRGQATIVADEYETGIECDSSNFSARFVSVVRNVELAGDPGEGGGC